MKETYDDLNERSGSSHANGLFQDEDNTFSFDNIYCSLDDVDERDLKCSSRVRNNPGSSRFPPEVSKSDPEVRMEDFSLSKHRYTRDSEVYVCK